MSKQIEIVLLSKDPVIKELIKNEINSLNFQANLHIVEDTGELSFTISSINPDAVIVDYPEISFIGLSTLAVVKASNLNIHIIFIKEYNLNEKLKNRFLSVQIQELDQALRRLFSAEFNQQPGLDTFPITELLESIDKPIILLQHDYVFLFNKYFKELLKDDSINLIGSHINKIFNVKYILDEIEKIEIISPNTFIKNESKYELKLEKLNSIYSLISFNDISEFGNKKSSTNLLDPILGIEQHDVRTLMNSILGNAQLLEEQLRHQKDIQYYSFVEGILKSANMLVGELDWNKTELDINPEIDEVDVVTLFSRLIEDIKFNSLMNNIPITNHIKKERLILTDDVLFRKGVVDFVFAFLKKYKKACFDFDVIDISKRNIVSIIIKVSCTDFDFKDIPDLNSNNQIVSNQFILNEILWLRELVKKCSGNLNLNKLNEGGLVLEIHLPVPVKSKDTLKDAVYFTGSPDLIYLYDNNPLLLIVEDHPDSLRMLELTLKKVARLETAFNGESALQIIQKKYEYGQLFDLMLFDIGLPEPYNGIQLLREVRARWKEYQDIPFIAETAFATREDREKIISFGFDAFVSKPIDRKLLVKTLAASLKNKKATL